jgi:hypothetical protein
MKARLAWYAVMQCTISDDIRAVSGIVGLIDRYSFWLSVIIGIVGWAYISGRRQPTIFYTAYHRQFSRFLLLSIVATGALVVSVISDGVLTALRLPETELSPEFLFPVFSMAIEIACAGVLVFQIHRVTQRATSTRTC